MGNQLKTNSSESLVYKVKNVCEREIEVLCFSTWYRFESQKKTCFVIFYFHNLLSFATSKHELNGLLKKKMAPRGKGYR